MGTYTSIVALAGNPSAGDHFIIEYLLDCQMMFLKNPIDGEYVMRRILSSGRHGVCSAVSVTRYGCFNQEMRH